MLVEAVLIAITAGMVGGLIIPCLILAVGAFRDKKRRNVPE